ncbi:MAG: Flp pilus assembly complex ATPase component TadA [Planctomycetes bacterium]|nr:Flp pilus assembly complex ATPase component TadA [Planctomycetota bacterium]
MECITEGQLQEALVAAKERGIAIGRALVDLEFVTQEELSIALAEQYGLRHVDLDGLAIPAEVISKIDPMVAQTSGLMPIEYKNRALTVAASDPSHPGIEDLKFVMPGIEIVVVIAPEDQIQRAIGKYYGNKELDLTKSLEVLDADDKAKSAKGEKLDLDQEVHAGPVVTLVNQILHKGIQARAADIHFEPFEDKFNVRMRIDGVLYDLIAPPKHLAPVITSRIKVLSKLDIAETRLPQDGRIELTIAGRPIDLRVSTLPTMFGESCVMRILDRSNVKLDLENVGLRAKELDLVRALIAKPNGIVLVTGPTGSGKTTTLYSALNEINTIDVKLITTEDPVEYNLDGIIQVQVNDEIGTTYAACLRSILRQDPDKILVGEIRDKETATIAIEASLTGHLVLSTLHTNDAPSSITRLLDMGVENFLIAATVEAVIGQRLVRRICPDCRAAFSPKPDQLLSLGIQQSQVQGKQFAYGKGSDANGTPCPTCNGTGYKGRLAIFEILLMTDPLRALVMESASTDRLRAQAKQEGMRTLRQSGIQAILDGITTMEEVIRETLSFG